MRPLILLAFAVLLAACAGDIYRPAGAGGGAGWRETALERDRYRITFTGSSSTDVGTVQDLALLRAAELTLSKGFTWFTVVSSDVVEENLRSAGGSAVLSTGRWRTYGGWLIIQDDDRGRMVATLEIVMGKGTKPEGDPRAYDAQDVANTIRARMKP